MARSPLLCFLFVLKFIHSGTAFECLSYGVDYVDGGGPYCVNTASSAPFSFTSYFEGCDSNEGSITPILIDPNGDEYFCSDTSCVPDNVHQVSTCNVTGNEVLKKNMYSGNWIMVIEGYTFAWMRTFAINAEPLQTLTQTPTAIFNVTQTPMVTTSTTSTAQYNETLSRLTVTVPSATVFARKTLTPSKVTTMSTKFLTATKVKHIYTKIIVTTTKTTTCHTQHPRKDPTCTIHVSKTSARSVNASASSARQYPGLGRRVLDKASIYRGRRGATYQGVRQPDSLEKRSLDVCTTSVLETNFTLTIINTSMAPTSTVTDPFFTTLTWTITPSPFTIASGMEHVNVTITLPTSTRTITVKHWTTSTKTKTVTARSGPAPCCLRRS